MYKTTAQLAAELNRSRTTVWRACCQNPGFAIRLGHEFRIPNAHIERLKRGETAAQIAATVRADGIARSA